MKEMLIDYMGRGFLENIIALFRQDGSLYPFIADMIGHENIRVRLGATALVEELSGSHRNELKGAVPGLVALLRHENPTIRGDAVSVLGMIGDENSVEAVKGLLLDDHPGVREAAREVLAEFRKGENPIS